MTNNQIEQLKGYNKAVQELSGVVARIKSKDKSGLPSVTSITVDMVLNQVESEMREKVVRLVEDLEDE